MTESFAVSDAKNAVPPDGLPTRIITYAWGEKYLGHLLSLAIPALLAPGNLPYVAATVRCELVLLTEERFFSYVLNHPTIIKARSFCPLRLISLDDLISNKDSYGLSLTYALHRGFADLGTSVTDSWLIFLNADFIMANGSLRNLMAHLFRGERLVAAPSYCVNSEDVLPQLPTAIDTETKALNIEPRHMAGMILRHSHNTVRAKTFNQTEFHHYYTDQFYWRANPHTILGYQMPAAIVGMRPERYLPEPNAIWDHGLMKEFCPESNPCVLGDSDEFLMMELRDRAVAKADLVGGPPDFEKLGERMALWVTPYQRDFAQYPLTLHDEDLAPNVETERAKLRKVAQEILASAPPSLPSHQNHPQWAYHRVSFFQYRHEFMSRSWGEETRHLPPPADAFEIDRIWWTLDGIRKAHAAARAMYLSSFENKLVEFEKDIVLPRQEDLLSVTNPCLEDLDRRSIFANFLVDGIGAADTSWSSASARRLPEIESKMILPIVDMADHEKARIGRIGELAMSAAESGLKTLQNHFDLLAAPLEEQYESLLQRDLARSLHSQPIATLINQSGGKTTAIRRLLQHVHEWGYGKFPYVTQLSPYWAPLRHLIRIISNSSAEDVSRALLIQGSSRILERIFDNVIPDYDVASVTEARNQTSMHELANGHRYDLIICNLTVAEGEAFGKIYHAVRPLLNSGGRLVGFLLNDGSPPRAITSGILLDSHDQLDIHYSGSIISAVVIHWLRKAAYLSFLPTSWRRAFATALLTPVTFYANLRERRFKSDAIPFLCTSVTISITKDMAHNNGSAEMRDARSDCNP